MREMKDSRVDWISYIPIHWTINKVNRIFNKIGSGTTPKSNAEKYYNGNNFWIQSGDLGEWILFRTNKRVSDLALQECSALKMYKAPFICIAMYGASIGNMSISNIDACTNQACCTMSLCQGNLVYFAYAFFVAKEYFLFSADGSAQTNINQEIIKTTWLPVPPVNEQNKIVSYLDSKCVQINEAIRRQESIIKKLEEYRQSVITETVTKGLDPNAEMKESGIEWIGDIPSSWALTRVKYVSELNPACNTSELDKDSVVTYTPMENIKNGYFINSKAAFKKCLASSYTMYEEGDIVIAKVTPCFENGNISIMENLSNGFGFGSSELFVERPFGINSRYLFYWFQGYKFIHEGIRSMRGTGGLKRITTDFMNNSFLCLPPINEQKKIVNFLDCKCFQINESIHRHKELIEKLKSYRRSLVYEVVTGKKEV